MSIPFDPICRDARVQTAVAKVPRGRFVPDAFAWAADHDRALPIGRGQTISQPSLVALMTELCALTPSSRVLEVGTGSGYQAAVLAELANRVFTVERIGSLHEAARARLDALGYKNVSFRLGDGCEGWAEHAPYDAIVVTAAPERVPRALLAQLTVGGRLVIPVGSHASQQLFVITRTESGFEERSIIPVIFVPLICDDGEDARA